MNNPLLISPRLAGKVLSSRGGDFVERILELTLFIKSKNSFNKIYTEFFVFHKLANEV